MRYFVKDIMDLAMKAVDTDNWVEFDNAEAEREAMLKNLFDSLVSGKINAFYQRTNHNMIIWHRSTREGVLVQESHACFINGEFIPCYHANINSFDDFLYENGYMTDEYIETA